jgi:hypothetical protein
MVPAGIGGEAIERNSSLLFKLWLAKHLPLQALLLLIPGFDGPAYGAAAEDRNSLGGFGTVSCHHLCTAGSLFS